MHGLSKSAEDAKVLFSDLAESRTRHGSHRSLGEASCFVLTIQQYSAPSKMARWSNRRFNHRETDHNGERDQEERRN
jgi:hypothetical protein